MLIDFYQERGTAIATPLCPRLDAVKAPAFRNAAAAIAQQQLEEDVVVIDLDHVSYLDMSGMWALLCFGQMIDASREVRLCNLRTQPKSVARRVDADLVLDIYSSREAAITEARQVETRTVAQVWKLPAVGGLFSRTMAWTR